MGVIKGDTRSSDYGSYDLAFEKFKLFSRLITLVVMRHHRNLSHMLQGFPVTV